MKLRKVMIVLVDGYHRLLLLKPGELANIIVTKVEVKE